jgi:Flp pilus assembly secretin CpaC
MSVPGLIAIAVLSGSMLGGAPNALGPNQDITPIPINLGESYLFEVDREVTSIQVNEPEIIRANLLNTRTVTIHGERTGIAHVVFFGIGAQRLFETTIKVAPLLRGKQ